MSKSDMMVTAKHLLHVSMMFSTPKKEKKNKLREKISHEELVKDKFESCLGWETISTEQANTNNKENVPYVRINIWNVKIRSRQKSLDKEN